MTHDEKILLTSDEAISLLPEGEHVHNYVNPSAGMFIGCDYDRADAENHIREAIQREIAGPGCQGMKHGLAVWSSKNRVSFFETDMQKLKAMEYARLPQDSANNIPENEQCEVCRGDGTIAYLQPWGRYSEPATCYKCEGTGRRLPQETVE